MKPTHERYVELVRSGPSGLFSRGDLARLDAHVADGAVGAALLRSCGAASVVDIGSGGGIPGLPLALEIDDLSVELVESQAWKAEFLRTCVRALDLESRVTVHAIRAEETPAALGRERFDAGTARALAQPIVVAEYLAPLVAVGGQLLLWTTAAHAALPQVAACAELGLGDPTAHPAPSPLRDGGVLLAWPKVAPCSDRFPRRVGVAAKRPLRR